MIVIFVFNVDLNEKTITYKSVDGRTSKGEVASKFLKTEKILY